MRERNLWMDFFRVIACALIIFCHTTYSYLGINRLIVSMESFAVPYFFMIAGFFCDYSSLDGKELAEKFTRKIRYVISLIIVAFLLELIYQVLLLRTFTFDFSIGNLILLTCFNACYIFGKSQPLWFLFSLIYCYLIIWIVNNKKKENILVVISCVLLYFCFFLEILFSKGIISNNCYYRNWMFEGVPMMTIGKNFKRFTCGISQEKRGRFFVLILILGMVLSFLQNIVGISFEINVGGIIMALAVIGISLNVTMTSKWLKVIAVFGKNCSMIMYIVHLYIYDIVCYILRDFLKYNFVQYISPVVNIILSAIVAYFMWKLKNKIKFHF